MQYENSRLVKREKKMVVGKKREKMRDENSRLVRKKDGSGKKN